MKGISGMQVGARSIFISACLLAKIAWCTEADEYDLTQYYNYNSMGFYDASRYYPFEALPADLHDCLGHTEVSPFTTYSQLEGLSKRHPMDFRYWKSMVDAAGVCSDDQVPALMQNIVSNCETLLKAAPPMERRKVLLLTELFTRHELSLWSAKKQLLKGKPDHTILLDSIKRKAFWSMRSREAYELCRNDKIYVALIASILPETIGLDARKVIRESGELFHDDVDVLCILAEACPPADSTMRWKLAERAITVAPESAQGNFSALMGQICMYSFVDHDKNHLEKCKSFARKYVLLGGELPSNKGRAIVARYWVSHPVP
jgi:hypothetical protein